MAFHNLLNFCIVFFSLYWLPLLASPAAELRFTSSSWQQYIRAPTNRIVHPVRILSDLTAGNVTNADGLLKTGRGSASSFHAANTNNGQPRTYNPGNAIDGDLETFWNDDTIAAYPDILTITAPSAVNLSGITIQSNSDGVPQDFTVDVLENNAWTLAGTISGNTNIRCPVSFGKAVSTKAIRITVTRDQSTSQGEFTRINEVWPGIVPPDPAAPRVVVDFGQNIVGFLQVAFAGASANYPGVRFAFSETTEYLTNISDFTRSDNGDTITPGTDQFPVPAEPFTWIDTHGCLDGSKVCADGLHGFRYLKIYLDALAADAPDTQAYGEVSIDAVSLNFTGYLGTPNTFTGWFECSDTQLNQFWYDAAYTNEMCIDTFRVNDTDPRNAASPSLIGKLVLFDGAKRDRDPYVGDLAVSARTAYLTHDVSDAARNVLADLADHQRADGWIPPASINNYTLPLFDYPLWWVTCSYDLLVYTGDTSYAQKYYSTLVRVLDAWYPSVTDSATGLLSKGLNGTSGYGDYAFLPRSDEVTYYNALYVLALGNAASIARFLGNHESDAQRWSQRAQTVSAAINAHLWDSVAGAYLDSSTGAIRHGQDGNSIAVLASVANSTRATSLLSYFAAQALPYGNPFFDNDALGAGFSQRVYAYISYFEIQARFLSGSTSSALEQVRRMYSWMATRNPTTTFWEGIGTNGSMYEGAYTSAAHGWSTGVLPALTNFVLGITPTGPGFKTWTIKPMPGDVTWAKGVVPTPSGPLSVSWTMAEPSTQFDMQIEAPTGTQGGVSVPVSGEKDKVFVDGQMAWNGKEAENSGASYADGYVTVHVQGGKHSVTVKK